MVLLLVSLFNWSMLLHSAIRVLSSCKAFIFKPLLHIGLLTLLDQPLELDYFCRCFNMKLAFSQLTQVSGVRVGRGRPPVNTTRGQQSCTICTKGGILRSRLLVLGRRRHQGQTPSLWSRVWMGGSSSRQAEVIYIKWSPLKGPGHLIKSLFGDLLDVQETWM